MSDFEVPAGVTEFVREHLVGVTEIAEQVGVTKQAVSQWMQRYPEFEALIVVPRYPLFWWPQVQALLKELGLPNLKASASQKTRRGRAGR
ncbi:hypothetical protein [Streptosporangium vulgare]|uniref:Helix-turn-helix domain-containing protein n=1 Tax=Streptosporangium vulgare TaxID=46190 RepID=A0ABV5TQL1_9ACTN